MIKRKPYFLLLIASILFVALIFIPNSETTLDINVHDTYYVIKHSHLYGLLAVIMFTLFALYWSFDKGELRVIKSFSYIHIYGTLIGVLGLFFPYGLIFKWTHPTQPEFPLFDDYEQTNLYISLSALLFLIAQLLFIINIFVSIIKKLCSSATQ